MTGDSGAPMTRLKTAIVALLALLTADIAPAQQRAVSLLLIVTEDASGQPVPGARVQVSGVKGAATTDNAGRAVIRGISPGRRMLSVTHIGHAPEHVSVDFDREDVEAEISLIVQPVELEGVTVTSWGRNQALPATSSKIASAWVAVLI